jgi:periplasmic protein TonB
MSELNGKSTSSGLDAVCRWLIHYSARRAPEPLPPRLEEEWLADLECRSSALSRLRFAIGCRWAALVIAFEHPISTAATAGSATLGRGVSIPWFDHRLGFASRRVGTLFLIAALHGAIFYALITAYSHTHSSPLRPNLENTVVVPEPPHEKVTVSQPGVPTKTWLIVPIPHPERPPEIPVPKDEAIRADDAIAPDLPQLPTQPPPTHVVKQLLGGPGRGFPDTADFYPSVSVFAGEEGSVTVQVCVDINGKLTGVPTTVKNSGSARLDEAAIKLARAGSGHYRATTEDGQAVNSCYPLGIRFQLKNR